MSRVKPALALSSSACCAMVKAGSKGLMATPDRENLVVLAAFDSHWRLAGEFATAIMFVAVSCENPGS